MFKEKTDSSFRFSRFLHVLDVDQQKILFHSLTIEVIFLSMEAFELISEFKTGKNIGHIIIQKKLNSSETKTFTALVKRLVALKMLVSLFYNEDEELSVCQKDNLKKPMINMAYLVLIDDCNLRCKYCFVEGGISEDYKFSHMSSDVVKRSLDLFAKWTAESKSRNKTIIFYGGEPLLNKESFCAALKYVSVLKKQKLLPKDIEISIITNGTLIDKDVACFMKEHNVFVGISVDGMPEINDEYRCFPNNKGSFDAIEKGCKILKDVGIDISLSITMTPSNIKDLLKNVQWLIKRFQPKGVGLNLLMDGTGQIISSLEYAEIASKEMIKCFEFLRKNGIYENRMMRKVESFIQKRIYPCDCGGCGRQVVFLPSGQVGMCQAYISTKKFFSIPGSKFSPYTDSDFLKWANRSPLIIPQCSNCIALGICGGGCPARADFRHGSIFALDEIFCVHAKETIKWMINDLYRHEVGRR